MGEVPYADPAAGRCWPAEPLPRAVGVRAPAQPDAPGPERRSVGCPATGQSIQVHYTGVRWRDGKKFDSSGDKGGPVDIQIGEGKVIPGWDKGLVGQTVGSRILLVVPPADGYGAAGKPPAIGPKDTMVFVVDILAAI